MGKTVSIGAQSFEFLRKNEYFFVDKTGFISEASGKLSGDLLKLC